MVTRREFLDTTGRGSGRPCHRLNGQKLRPDSRLERTPQLRRHRPERPRLCASFLAQGQPGCGTHRLRLRCGKQHPGQVCRRNQQDDGLRLPRPRRTSARFSSARTSMPSPSPRRITGMRRWRFSGCRPGKHVYVEKPCSHNPGEGALLVEAQQKYGKLVQMGTQQRSSPHTIEIVNKIHSGLIGRAYFAKCWYDNTRKSIGFGKACARCRRRSTGICGRVPRRASPTRTTCSPTTGTGSGSGARARR